MSFSFAFGQHPQVKKETKIVYSYDYTYIKDEKLYLSKKGDVTTDTIITEFNNDGTSKNEYRDPYVKWVDSIVLVSVYNNNKHQREYWSDTTFLDVYSQNFGDSIIEIKTSGIDTIQINKFYFHKGYLIKSHRRELRQNYSPYQEIRTYDRKTKTRENFTIVTTYFEGGLGDTVRVNNDYKKKLYKSLVFNSDKNEWYVIRKRKYYNRKIVYWETFYHDYHKMYFTTKTTIKYNKMKQPISEIKYDTYLKLIETKTTYEYEYY